MQIGKRRVFLPALALGLLALPAVAQAQSQRRPGPYERGPSGRRVADPRPDANERYDARERFERSTVVTPYDSYWFEPGFRGNPGSYTAWEWSRETDDWTPVGAEARVRWSDPGAEWYASPLAAGPAAAEIEAGREYVWNPERRRWELTSAAGARDFTLFTEEYAAATSPRERQTRGGSQPGDASRMVRVNGTIQGFRQLDLLGRSEPHLVVKLREEDRERFVDLGPKSGLDGADLANGGRITVHGREGSIDGRDVLMALRISANGKVTEVERAPPPAERPSVVGELRDWKRIDLANRRESHTYLLVEPEDGRDTVVDVGPDANLDELGLGRGDRIAVVGRETNADGRPILVAHTIRAEGAADGAQGDRISRQPWRTDVTWDELAIGDGRYRFDGYIEDWRQVDTAEGSRSSLAKMCLEDGSCMIVDLGPDVTLTDLRLQKGSWITITGTRSSVNANPVLRAEQIRVSGRTVDPGTGRDRDDYDEYD